MVHPSAAGAAEGSGCLLPPARSVKLAKPWVFALTVEHLELLCTDGDACSAGESQPSAAWGVSDHRLQRYTTDCNAVPEAANEVCNTDVPEAASWDVRVPPG